MNNNKEYREYASNQLWGVVRLSECSQCDQGLDQLGKIMTGPPFVSNKNVLILLKNAFDIDFDLIVLFDKTHNHSFIMPYKQSSESVHGENESTSKKNPSDIYTHVKTTLADLNHEIRTFWRDNPHPYLEDAVIIRRNDGKDSKTCPVAYGRVDADELRKLDPNILTDFQTIQQELNTQTG
jgi:hypothetical protein